MPRSWQEGKGGCNSRVAGLPPSSSLWHPPLSPGCHRGCQGAHSRHAQACFYLELELTLENLQLSPWPCTKGCSDDELRLNLINRNRNTRCSDFSKQRGCLARQESQGSPASCHRGTASARANQTPGSCHALGIATCSRKEEEAGSPPFPQRLLPTLANGIPRCVEGCKIRIDSWACCLAPGKLGGQLEKAMDQRVLVGAPK